MQKQFQKFGHFVLKNLNDEPNAAPNDKYVKYIYKKESGSAEKSHKRKIKSANDADRNSRHSRNYSYDERNRRNRKRSSESLGRARRRKDSLSNNLSETEIFFISPEEIRKHRKKVVRNKEESPGRARYLRSPSRHKDQERIGAKRTEDRFEKFLKDQKQKKDKNDYQWLTKKEIFKLINNAKEPPKPTSPGANFLKKFFVFDKHDSQSKAEFIPVSGKNYKKAPRYSEDNTNVIFLPFKENTKERINKDLVKASRQHEKSSKEHPEDVTYSRDSKKNKQKCKVNENRSIEKYYRDVQTKSSKKRKSQSPINCNLVFEDLSAFQKRDVGNPKYKGKQEKKESGNSKSTQKVQSVQLKESRNSRASTNKLPESRINSQEMNSISHTKTKSKKKLPDADEELGLPNQKKEELQDRLQNISRANPVRHRFCLVKNTFAVVEIPPVIQADDNSLENKKKLKAFKKYYKYSRSIDKDSEITNSTTFKTFSDSHKLYQDMSEQPVEDTRKKRHRRSRRTISSQGFELNLETHVSSVVINPEPRRIISKPSEKSQDDRKIRGDKVISQKSKIPVPSNYSKIVELARDASPVSKSRKKSADLFNPKTRTHEEAEIVLNFDESKKRKTKIQKDKSSNDVEKEMVASPRSHREKQDKISERNRSHTSSLAKEKNETSIKERSLPSSKSPSDKSSGVGGSSKSSKSSRPQTARTKIEESNSGVKPETKSRPSAKTRIDKEETKVSRTSTVSRQSKGSSFNNKSAKGAPKFTPGKNKNPSPSVSPTHRKKSDDVRKGVKSSSKCSNDDASTTWSRISSKKSVKSSLTSRSDTKLQGSKRASLEKCKNFDRSSAKTSVSNSTCGDKSADSSKTGTSFLLTKSYRDDDKLNRWQKRKQYADNLRKNVRGKNQKEPVIPPQVLEVRYLTISNSDTHDVNQKKVLFQEDKNELVALPSNSEDPQSKCSQPLEVEDLYSSIKQFYEDDLPQPCVEGVDSEKFKELFALPVEEALNEILNENFNFLKKDFSYTVDTKCTSSEDDVSTDDLLPDMKVHDWYNLKMTNPESLSEISCCARASNEIGSQGAILGSQDHIIDSLSAPGSEESGYSTIKSRRTSQNFFERPEIKALFDPPQEISFDYCVEVQIDANSSSSCGLAIHSIESKSLQTTVECSQKSVQIKMSREETLEVVTRNDGRGEADDVNEHEADEEKKLTLPTGGMEGEKATEVTGKHDERTTSKLPLGTNWNSELIKDSHMENTNKDDIVDNHDLEESDSCCRECDTKTTKTKTSTSEKKKSKNIAQGKMKKFIKKISLLSCFSGVSSNK